MKAVQEALNIQCRLQCVLLFFIILGNTKAKKGDKQGRIIAVKRLRVYVGLLSDAYSVIQPVYMWLVLLSGWSDIQ